MNRIIIMICLAVATSGVASTQVTSEESYWQVLSKLTYKKKYNELLGFKIDMPVFSKSVEALEGEYIELNGYIIPTEGYQSHKQFIFSAYPYNLCFFCGGAGPETVIEVTAVEPIKYTSAQIRIRGKLRLNADDINRLMYALEDVEEVK